MTHPPVELTETRLTRLGEGIGKVVYASRHWVVKRERTRSAIITLIVLWRILKRIEHLLPAAWARRLLHEPSRRLRVLRVLLQGFLLVVPRGLWFTTNIRAHWKLYRARDLRGSRLAQTHLSGTTLVPETITFPPTRVRVNGWPGWLMVSEATERVETTLFDRLKTLGAAGRFDEVELWLNRFLALRREGWKRGLFSVDAHLKNFGVSEGRVVLLDSGGLTDRWEDIEQRLTVEDSTVEPHIRLGLGATLGPRPDLAARFNAAWRATVNHDEVRRHWPGPVVVR